MPLRFYGANLMTEKILAIDIGQKTGWALQDGNQITSGTISFKPTLYEGGGMGFVRFKKWLRTIKPDIIFFERVDHKSPGLRAIHWYGGFLACITAYCEDNDIPYRGVGVKSIKKFITGNGGGKKNGVILAVKKKGFTPKDDNEADAIAILLYALSDLL